MRNPSHPSASLRRSLKAEGWDVRRFAAELGIAPDEASRLLNEHTGITPGIAAALERIGWSTADFWMRRQARYEAAKARLSIEESLVKSSG